MGAIFWKLAAGMGAVVFAALYEARGVRSELLHRLDALHLGDSGARVRAQACRCETAGAG